MEKNLYNNKLNLVDSFNNNHTLPHDNEAEDPFRCLNK